MLVAPHDLLSDVLESGWHEQRADPDLHRVLGQTSGAVRGSNGREGRESEHQGPARRRQRRDRGPVRHPAGPYRPVSEKCM